MSESDPAYSGQPVILIHLVMDDGETAYCADRRYYPPASEAFPGIPRVACPACMSATRKV